VSAKREDVLKLTLDDYLEWRDQLREAFIWVSDFLADRHIFGTKFLPYPKQLVPLAAIRAVMGKDADLIGPKANLVRWFWCGILGELYGGAIETRFVRDLEQVPAWAMGEPDTTTPNTINDATFAESRLHSLRTRQAAAYKGIYALLLGNEARDWMLDKALDKVQYTSLAIDIHHIFPQDWCKKNGIDDEHRESVVNKTAVSATTNRTILVALHESEDNAAHLQVALNNSREIGTAIGVLMAHHKVTQDAAFALLRQASQTLHRKLRDVAAEVVTTGTLPDLE
jgi:hypothetical protein